MIGYEHIKEVTIFVLHCGMMFLGAVINLKQTKIPKTLKLINIIATITYSVWLISKIL